MQPKIELLKARDFGEIITDTFVFLKQNLWPLVKCFFLFCGVFLVASTIVSAMQQIKVMSLVNDVTLSNNSSRGPFAAFTKFQTFTWTYFAAILLSILTAVSIQVTVLSYMAIYKEKGNQPAEPVEVWGYFKYFFLKIFGGSIIVIPLVIVASIFCLAPGIYLYPMMSIIFPIMVFENTSFGYAFSKSFKIIKDNWWLTFGAIFVIILIVYVASLVVMFPASILTMGNVFMHMIKGSQISVGSTILTSVLQHLATVFYILPAVTIALCYFNLSENVDGTGLITRIGQIGNQTPDKPSTADEY